MAVRVGSRFRTKSGRIVTVARVRDDGSIVVSTDNGPRKVSAARFTSMIDSGALQPVVRHYARRTPCQRAADRDALFASIGTDWQTVPDGAHESDVQALIRDGRIVATVRTEWDRQGGAYAHAFFGGAGVVQRRRRYVRRVA